MTKFCPTSGGEGTEGLKKTIRIGEGTEGLKKNYQSGKDTEIDKCPVVSQYSLNSFHWKEGEAEREDKENVQEECCLKG